MQNLKMKAKTQKERNLIISFFKFRGFETNFNERGGDL